MQAITGFFRSAIASNNNDMIPISSTTIQLNNESKVENKHETNNHLVQLYKPLFQLPTQLFNIRMVECLNKIKNDLFDPLTFKYWENVAICGGYALDLLYGINTSSDIDVYIYGVKSQGLVDTIAETITKAINGST